MTRSMPKNPFLALALALALAPSWPVSTAAGEEPASPPKVTVRYRMPSIIFLAHADWPKDPKHRDAMAKFVVNHGFNAVEGGMDVLDVCRQNGLKVQLGGDQARVAGGRLAREPQRLEVHLQAAEDVALLPILGAEDAP